MSKKQAYINVLNELNKNSEEIADEFYLHALRRGLETRIKIQEIAELFNIPDLPENKGSGNYIKIDDERAILYCRQDTNYISSPDDDEQGRPRDEYLYKIKFPCGAYTFSSSHERFYPEEVFKLFFDELKTYGPKYSDSRNNSLFFSPDNAFKIHKDYKNIFDKYKAKANAEYKNIKKKQLEDQIKKLEEASQ